MTDDTTKPAARDAPFAASPPTASGGRVDGGRLSAGTKTQFTTPGAAAAGRPTHSASFTAASDADPSALLFSNPAHAPPSLVQRAHSTETLFQYYAQRGYKELLMASNGSNAGKAVQTCLGSKQVDASADAAGLSLGAKKKKSQPKNTHVIDRCIAELPSGVPEALRPPRALDKISVYLTQQADDARADVKANRRAQLHQPPTETAYVGRYYPTGVDVLPRMPGAGGGASGATSGGARVNRQSTSSSLLPCRSNSGVGRMSGSAKVDANGGGASGRTPSLTLLLRAPQEAAVQVEQQREARHLLAHQVDEVFEAAARRRGGGAAAAAAPQRKSTVRAASAMSAAAAGTAAVGGGFPANLTLFRSSLLLLSNEDGAVALDQLCAMAADVPYNVGATTTTTSAPAGATAVLGSVNAVQRLFRLLHPNTRAPNAPDATDLLLAVASTTAPSGGTYGNRQTTTNNNNNDNSLSYGGGTTYGAPRGGTNSTSAGNGRRGMGASVSAAAGGGGGATNRATRTSIQGATRGAASPTGAPLHPPATSVSFACNAHNAKGGAAGGASGVWKEMSSPVGTNSKQQQLGFAAGLSRDLKDSRRCVLILELLDALDALLNSPETRQVVRWECFAVLAGEGHGYIHTAQLALLRRHAYRDGSASEVSAAVTASMVRALEDAFRIIATEEEAAYLKANKKGRKGGAGGGAPLHSNQKSVIPLHQMRTSHMDFATFCRFFEELPQMPAAFAHVWLPLLLDGARRRSEVAIREDDDSEDSDTSMETVAKTAAGALDGAMPMAVEGLKRDSTAENGGATTTTALPSGPSKSVSSPGDDGEEGYPLELLGSTAAARQALVQRLVVDRLEQLQEAWDALEKQKLQDEPSGAGSGAFGGPDTASSPTF